jgi:hypothetical protein
MRGFKSIALIAPLALLLAVAATRARAEHGPGGPFAGACRPDVEALCPSVTPGPGSFHYCLGQLCPDLSKGPGGSRHACRSTGTSSRPPASSS